MEEVKKLVCRKTLIHINKGNPLSVGRQKNQEHGTFRNIPEHAETFRNTPEHEKIKIIFIKKL